MIKIRVEKKTSTVLTLMDIDTRGNWLHFFLSLPISPINNGHYIFCSFFWVNHPLMDPFELGMNSSNVQLSSSSWGGASRTDRRPHAKILPTHSIWISISNRYYKVRIIIHKRQKNPFYWLTVFKNSFSKFQLEK